MSPFIAELLGTAFIIVIGDGVVANVILPKTKGNNGGLISITFAWGMAVFIGVYVSAAVSGAHLNPAVTIALACIGKFSWALVPVYLLAQLLGAMLGALLVWIIYKAHLDEAKDAATKLAVFSTSPAIKNHGNNFLTEFFSTLIFIIGVLAITPAAGTLGSLNALPVALLVVAIGLGLGGPTGYAINPARDLGPRIMHALLPIKGKGSSEWWYAWIPISAPILGGVAGAFIWVALH